MKSNKIKRYPLKKSLLLLFLVIVLICTFMNGNALLSLIIPGYNHNPVCKSHALVEGKDMYDIPAAKTVGNGMSIKVEHWGEFSYQYPTLGFNVLSNQCEAKVLVTPNSEGMTVSIGTNLNGNFRSVLKINLDLYVYVDPKSDKSYDVENVLQSFADNFELLHDDDGRIILHPKNVDPEHGALIIQKYDDKEFPASNSFELVSADEGQTWQFNPITYDK